MQGNLKSDESAQKEEIMMLALFLISASLSLEWDANSEPDLSGYRVYQRDDSLDVLSPYTLVQTTTGTTVTIPIKNAINYSYYVTAYNASGLESDPSNIVSYVKIPDLSFVEEGHMETSVFQGGHFLLETSSDLKAWAPNITITASTDDISIPVLMAPDHLFFRLTRVYNAPGAALRFQPKLKLLHHLRPTYEKGGPRLMRGFK